MHLTDKEKEFYNQMMAEKSRDMIFWCSVPVLFAWIGVLIGVFICIWGKLDLGAKIGLSSLVCALVLGFVFMQVKKQIEEELKKHLL